MKTLPCLALTALLLTPGCVRHYKVTLDNQQVTTTHGKPKVDQKRGVVTFKDAEGQRRTVPIFTVKQIEPY
jgi:hypothetical protein